MKILVVLAHPDDEAFGPGGTLARSAKEGHTVRLATMTRGEAGTLGPAKGLTQDQLARVRSEELKCSAAALQLAVLQIYDLPDGQLAELPAGRGPGVVRLEIESFQPDALITFHSAGISGHPDHQAVARWCLQCVREMRNPPRMFAYGLSSEQARRATHRKLVPIPDAEITHVIDVSGHLSRKFDAIRCHRTQAEAWERMMTVQGGIESYLGKEHFSLVWPAQERRAGEILQSLEE